MLVRMGGKGNTHPLLVGGQIVQPLRKSIWQFLGKLKIVLPEDPAIPLLGIYLKDASPYSRDKCSTMFIATLFKIVQK